MCTAGKLDTQKANPMISIQMHVQQQEKNNVSTGKQSGRESEFSLTLAYFLFRLWVNWMRPTHAGAGNLLHSDYWLKWYYEKILGASDPPPPCLISHAFPSPGLTQRPCPDCFLNWLKGGSQHAVQIRVSSIHQAHTGPRSWGCLANNLILGEQVSPIPVRNWQGEEQPQGVTHKAFHFLELHRGDWETHLACPSDHLNIRWSCHKQPPLAF
jgi:hypothetical protein